MRGLAIAVFVFLVALPSSVLADDTDEARRENDKAMSAFALGDYAEAAKHYERAFALKTDAALLYNAAQAQRLAGNKQRALLLYENLERMFSGQLRNKPELDRHIADLRAAIASENKSKGPPQTTAEPTLRGHADAPPPTTTTAPPPATEPAPPPATEPAPPAAPVLTATSAPRHDDRPLVKKPWFWGVVVGGVVVAGVAIGLGVGLGAKTNPTASLGGVTVN